MNRPKDKTILVVDDEPDIRQYLRAILEDACFKVLTASDGAEALRILREKQPDFISLDLVMPKKSGHRLLFELRKDRELARIPVLIVTAHARDEMGRQDLEEIMANSVMSGPCVYLEKPISPLSYVHAIQGALGIEDGTVTEEKINLKAELEESLQSADPEALRRALEALHKSMPKRVSMVQGTPAGDGTNGKE